MDDFSTFARDFGLKPQGKAAPMSQSQKSQNQPIFDDTFSNKPEKNSSFSDFDYDSIFKTKISNNNDSNIPKSSNSPVYDKPVYDEDIFDGLPGMKNKANLGSSSKGVSYDENVFASMSEKVVEKGTSGNHGVFDDILGNLGGTTDKLESKSMNGFDDLLPGFGSSPQRMTRSGSESSQSQKTSVSSTKPASVVDDPFAVLQSTSTPTNPSPKVFTDPLDEIGKLGNFANTQGNRSSNSRPVFDNSDPLDGFGKSPPVFSSEIKKEQASSREVSNDDKTRSTFRTEPTAKSPLKDSGSRSQKISGDTLQEFHQTMFDIPNVSTASRKSVGASPSYVNAEFRDINSHVDVSPGSVEQLDSADDAWLTVSEVPLFTQPTAAPAPSRPPPPIPGRHQKSETGFYARKKGNDFSSYPSYSEHSDSPKPSRPTVKSSMTSPIDELESFAMGRTRQNNDESADTRGSEEMDTNSSAAASAAAMKDAMDRAEAKFRHAKEVREREHAKSARNREPLQVEKDDHVMSDEQEREYRENEERLERERRLRDEEEIERKRLERERERANVEREKARQAVQRATREARERAAIEARERAAAETRRKSERAAVERAQAEARERAERAAVQRAQAEARERAAAGAKERSERATAEARERVNAEAREKAAANARAEAEARRKSDRAAVDRAAAEARERAASAAWTNQQKNDSARMSQQRSDSARMNQQQKNDNDLESFFSMNSRPSSAPRPRDPTVDPIFQTKVGSEGTKRTSPVNTSANIKKTPSATNFVDDLSSIFGGTAPSGSFLEVEGESEERRSARLERHKRTQERAAKALAEKNQRDLQSQMDQEERNRIGETLDIEVKRWAAGKEGNLRALLSTMQYVLWPECGWTPVSLTDLITGASVKKVYRKATLCIHPDKVQQKGATLQQKYIAEKVFDLLKEAWNKFSSEELF